MNKENLNNKNDSEVLALVLQNGSYMKCVPERLTNDKKFMMSVIEKNPLDIYYASEELKDDKELVLLAASKSGLVLEYVSKRLRADKDVALMAIKKDYLAYEDLSENLKNDIEILRIVLPEKGDFFKNCSIEIQNNKELALLSLIGGGFYENLTSEMKEDDEIALYALNKNTNSYRFMSEKHKEDSCFVIASLRDNFFNILYWPESVQKNLELLTILKEKYENPLTEKKEDKSATGQIIDSLVEKKYKELMNNWAILSEEKWMIENIPKQEVSKNRVKKF